MNLGQLEYLVEAVRLSSYAKAAKKLFVTPQAISKSIGDLEKELNVELLTKSGRGVKPTSFAIDLAARAEEPLHAFSDFRRFAESHSKPDVDFGPLSLGIATIYHRGSFFLPTDFDRFRQDHPHIDLELMFYSSESCLAAIQEEIIDAAIVLGRIDSPEYECQRLLSFNPWLAASESHELATFSSISLKQLNGCTLAMPSDFRYGYSAIRNALDKHKVRVEFESLGPLAETHRDFIASGGVMFVTKEPDIAHMFPEVKVIPFKDEDRLSFPLYLVFKRAPKPSPLPLLINYMSDVARIASKRL